MTDQPKIIRYLGVFISDGVDYLTGIYRSPERAFEISDCDAVIEVVVEEDKLIRRPKG